MKKIKKFNDFINEEVPFDADVYTNVYKDHLGELVKTNWTDEERKKLEQFGADEIKDDSATFNEFKCSYKLTKKGDNYYELDSSIEKYGVPFSKDSIDSSLSPFDQSIALLHDLSIGKYSSIESYKNEIF